mmetsp:Transcript_32314/g.65566  ORF Transcript_32314/g.65566 Transcript_32314/m.65566 type:complete len:211 (-) Transcript_32314:176-808(-)
MLTRLCFPCLVRHTPLVCIDDTLPFTIRIKADFVYVPYLVGTGHHISKIGRGRVELAATEMGQILGDEVLVATIRPTGYCIRGGYYCGRKRPLVRCCWQWRIFYQGHLAGGGCGSRSGSGGSGRSGGGGSSRCSGGVGSRTSISSIADGIVEVSAFGVGQFGGCGCEYGIGILGSDGSSSRSSSEIVEGTGKSLGGRGVHHIDSPYHYPR